MQRNCVLRTDYVNCASPQDLCTGLRAALTSALAQTSPRRKLSGYIPYFQVPKIHLLHLFQKLELIEMQNLQWQV